MNDIKEKEFEEFNDYLIEYLEKSGIQFYPSFIKLRILQDTDLVLIVNNRIKTNVKKEFKKRI